MSLDPISPIDVLFKAFIPRLCPALGYTYQLNGTTFSKAPATFGPINKIIDLKLCAPVEWGDNCK